MELRRNWAPADPPSVVTVGNFDGVHLGHQSLLEAVRRQATGGLVAHAVTFEPHPLCHLAPERAPPRLVDLRSKVALLAEHGADRVSVLAFNEGLAGTTAEEFVRRLVGTLGMRVLVVGSDFRFGRGRAGNVGMLRDMAAGTDFALEVVDDRQLGGDRVSSKLVREAVGSSDLERARGLLGRPYRIGGRVVRGLGIGRGLGWPTANVRFPGRPALKGIFAARAHVCGKEWPAALSVGTRPAVNGEGISVEAHLIGFEGDIYGERLDLEPVGKIRDESDFSSLDGLSAAIARDVRACAELLSS